MTTIRAAGAQATSTTPAPAHRPTTHDHTDPHSADASRPAGRDSSPADRHDTWHGNGHGPACPTCSARLDGGPVQFWCEPCRATVHAADLPREVTTRPLVPAPWRAAA